MTTRNIIQQQSEQIRSLKGENEELKNTLKKLREEKKQLKKECEKITHYKWGDFKEEVEGLVRWGQWGNSMNVARMELEQQVEELQKHV